MNKVTCREALARLFDYLDDEITCDDADAIRSHLEICQQCYPEVNFGRVFQETLRRAAQCQPAAPPALRAKILELLRAEGIDVEPS